MPDIASTADPAAMAVAVVALLIALGVLVLLSSCWSASATRNGT